MTSGAMLKIGNVFFFVKIRKFTYETKAEGVPAKANMEHKLTGRATMHQTVKGHTPVKTKGIQM